MVNLFEMIVESTSGFRKDGGIVGSLWSQTKKRALDSLGDIMCLFFSCYVHQQRYYLGVFMQATLKISPPLNYPYSKHLKLNLNLMFALNFSIIYLLEFLV